MAIASPTEPAHLVTVIGGAVSGSEAATALADAGVQVVVIEQQRRPYGKVEAGLPRAHVEQRRREYRRIDARLDRDGVEYVPSTRLGEHLPGYELIGWQPSAVVLSTGARRDRRLPEALHAYEDRGLLYQSPLVHWFHHYQDQDYDDQWYVIPDGTIVIAGSRASLDVVKICALEAARHALLEEHGIRMDVAAAGRQGLKAYLKGLNLSFEALNLEGPLLLYKRPAEDLPLTQLPDDADDRALAAAGVERKQMIERVLEDFGARFQDCTTVLGPLPDRTGQMLAGLRCARTDVEGSREYRRDDSEHDLPAPLVVSAVGSVPQDFNGLELRGDRWFVETPGGEPQPADLIVGVGSAVTGPGQEGKVTLRHSGEVARWLLESWLPEQPKLAPEHQQRILEWVRGRQAQVGYTDYATWTMRGGTGTYRQPDVGG